MNRHARGLLVRLVVTALAVLGVGMVPITTGTANAAPGDVGYVGPSYGPGLTGDFIDPDDSPSAHKPQSKLWFAQGKWWGVLEKPGASRTTSIHSFDERTQTWEDTDVVIDDRAADTWADVLWSGSEGKLYVATAGANNTANAIRVKRFRYDSSAGKYVNDPGLPTGNINGGGVEAAVLAKDSTGRLWVAYTSSSGVGTRVLRLLYSNEAQTSWSSPFTPAVDGTNVTADDIAAITHHDGKISVVWSNQVADAAGNTAVYAAQHTDSAGPETGWSASEKIFSGPNGGDDHISLASAEGAPSGKLFVAIKSAMDDANPIDESSGLVRVLVLRNNGQWESYVHSRVREDMTRPIILLEPSKNLIHVYATSPVAGGVIYHKSSPMGNISFETGMGEPFIKLADHDFVNNATSTKQHLTAESGILVLASDQKTGHYVHNYVVRKAPTAKFSYSSDDRWAPMEVSFKDESSGVVSEWSWDFGDGDTSSERNPTHTFEEAGSYKVTLTVENSAGSTEASETIEVAPYPDRPQVELDEPSTTFASSRTIDVAWHATTDPDEVSSYDVQVRRAGPARRSGWKSSVEEGLDAGSTSMQLTGRRGSTYCFRVRATSTADDVGPWSAMGCTAVPLDDRNMKARGRWRDATGAQYYEETARITRARGASLTRKVAGKEVALLVTRRPGGGKVLVYRNGRLAKRVSLGARKVRNQRFITVSSTKRVTTARYRVVVKTRGKPVTIDGIAVSRR